MVADWFPSFRKWADTVNVQPSLLLVLFFCYSGLKFTDQHMLLYMLPIFFCYSGHCLIVLILMSNRRGDCDLDSWLTPKFEGLSIGLRFLGARKTICWSDIGLRSGFSLVFSIISYWYFSHYFYLRNLYWA